MNITAIHIDFGKESEKAQKLQADYNEAFPNGIGVPLPGPKLSIEEQKRFMESFRPVPTPIIQKAKFFVQGMAIRLGLPIPFETDAERKEADLVEKGFGVLAALEDPENKFRVIHENSSQVAKDAVARWMEKCPGASITNDVQSGNSNQRTATAAVPDAVRQQVESFCNTPTKIAALDRELDRED